MRVVQKAITKLTFRYILSQYVVRKAPHYRFKNTCSGNAGFRIACMLFLQSLVFPEDFSKNRSGLSLSLFLRVSLGLMPIHLDYEGQNVCRSLQVSDNLCNWRGNCFLFCFLNDLLELQNLKQIFET